MRAVIFQTEQDPHPTCHTNSWVATKSEDDMRDMHMPGYILRPVSLTLSALLIWYTLPLGNYCHKVTKKQKSGLWKISSPWSLSISMNFFSMLKYLKA